MGGHVNTVWTDEQTADLIAFINNGLSYSKAAAALNDKFDTDFTRCAATGKGYRLGLSSPPKPKASPRSHSRKPRIASVKPISRVEEIQLRCAEIEPRHLTLDQLEPNDCRYPFGDNPFTFCGRHNADGSSYCIEHFRLTITHGRSNTDAVTEARARRMRSINFRKTLLEGA